MIAWYEVLRFCHGCSEFYACNSPVEGVRYPVISPNMAHGGEIVEEPVARMIEDMIYVAVAKDVKDSKSTLVWAVHNSGGKKICLAHVHQPSQKIPCSKSATFVCVCVGNLHSSCLFYDVVI